MVRGVNRIILIGNLTADPELRYTPQGTPVANFRIAVNRSIKDGAGGYKDEVMFLRIVVWDKAGETCAQYLSKGRPVLVEGRLDLRDYETKEGEKRTSVEVVADRVVFLSGGGSAAASRQAEVAPETPDDVPFY